MRNYHRAYAGSQVIFFGGQCPKNGKRQRPWTARNASQELIRAYFCTTNMKNTSIKSKMSRHGKVLAIFSNFG